MFRSSWLVMLLLHTVLPQTTDRYSDEDRPYKFGFNIQGYQHRQEEKDDKGLIKGEYGFITADGYYRVTVYATDENGDFRIISMKNYYVGFPPEDPTTTPGPASDRARQQPSPPSFGRAPAARGRALGGDDSNAGTPKAFTRPQGLAACSDCSIPTSTPKTNQPNLSVNRGEFRTGRTQTGSFQSSLGQVSTGGQVPLSQVPARENVQSPGKGLSQFPQTAQGPAGGRTHQFPQGGPRTNPQFSGGFGNNPPTRPGSSFDGASNPRPGGGFGSNAGDRAFGSPDALLRGRNDLNNNQLGDIPKRRPQIGEVRDGLPPGVSVNDIKDLLYTFNYTVGFHGHHEDGFRNGDKLGDYFFDGRDGVERKVEYLANEFGYQPNITLIDLPENDVRKPNEQTEKEYGLKGYEFKWFYRK